MVRKFPATVYRFFSTDEVRTFLSDAGFGEIHMVRQTVAARDLVFAVARIAPVSSLSKGKANDHITPNDSDATRCSW